MGYLHGDGMALLCAKCSYSLARDLRKSPKPSICVLSAFSVSCFGFSTTHPNSGNRVHFEESSSRIKTLAVFYCFHGQGGRGTWSKTAVPAGMMNSSSSAKQWFKSSEEQRELPRRHSQCAVRAHPASSAALRSKIQALAPALKMDR